MKKTVDSLGMTTRLKDSPAYKIAYHDLDFLARRELRPIRLQLELLKPEIILTEQRIESTIVVFGSTRIVEPALAKKAVKAAETKLAGDPGNAIFKRNLAIANSLLEKSKYYDEAREFARLVSTECQIDGGNRHEYVIVTGGGPGIMEAANRGAHEVNAKSIGLNITLPHEQEPNPYISRDLCMQFHYFALRKMHFLMRAKALVAFPGGFGTMDELFEALTLVQTQKADALPIVLFGEKYWKKLIDFRMLVDEGTIDEDDLKLFVFADKAADAWDYIKNFFKNNGTKK
ncbi:MAG TPA: TIGR00730 family Rossman fold protein [Candidatus Acidoferrum sp.]|nr:TIGR00730 family Rossman fold protein [Candidatus Acidoferrum sp.]